MASVADISRKTGYSVSTVASVLRGAPNFKEETRNVVQKAADEMNYQPNWLSKALAGAKSMTIGVFGSHFDDFSSIRKIQYIEKVVRNAGYLAYVVGSSVDDVDIQKNYLKNLLARKIDGLIVSCALVPPDKEIFEMLKKLDIPVVLMGVPEHEDMNCVVVNRDTGIADTIEHLKELGHKKVGLFANDVQFKSQDLKIKAYKLAAKRYGIELLDFEYCLYNEKLPMDDWTDEEISPLRDSVYDIGTKIYDSITEERMPSEEMAAYYALTKCLKETRDMSDFPTALITISDSIAMSAIKVLTTAGISVPDDISIVGFGELNMASMYNPGLSTVYMHRSPVGTAAAEMLLKLMNEPDKPVEPVVFNSRLLVRESTGPVRQKK